MRSEGTVEKNTIVLTFDSRGGPVSGEGHDLISSVHECGKVWYSHDIVFSGSCDQETGRLSGTAERTMRSETFQGPHPVCQRLVAEPYFDERPWQAQLAGDRITGTVAGWRFELVVQGQEAAD
jgi:hypothetical protein